MGLAEPNDPVAKGPVTRCLDELSISPEARPRLEALRRELIGLRDKGFVYLETVLAQHLFRGLYAQDEIGRIADYLRTYWFSPETGWWPSFQPIAPIYALGLLRTINASLAAKDPLPIDSYWIIGHTHVELVNLVSSRQVTLLIATPPPVQFAPPGIQGESSQAWVTARRAGRTAGEIDPLTEQLSPDNADLRVRTFKIQTRPPRRT